MPALQPVRGTRDILPEEMLRHRHVEQTAFEIAARYGFAEISTPIFEFTEVFSRTLGDTSDIVTKEMYAFEDRSGDSITLRPECTAGVVRAVLSNGLAQHLPLKFFCRGPMFRYERPQKGRQRQFHQIGAEAFGVASPDMDAELILMSARLWEQLGISAEVELQLNSIGSLDSRRQYRSALVEYLSQHVAQLDEDSQRRLESNPLRILDSKHPATQALLDSAPVMSDYLDSESKEDFTTLCDLLSAAGLSYTINPRLVRGLDYYNKTVFEWVTDKLGAQGTVCAGGRYDSLVEQLGGKATAGVGFAMGMERLVLLLSELELGDSPVSNRADVYVVAVGNGAYREALCAVESIRSAVSPCKIVQHTGGGSFKSQMKKADKSGARVALIWGEDEVAAGTVTIKHLRVQADSGKRLSQQLCPLAELPAVLSAALAINE